MYNMCENTEILKINQYKSDFSDVIDRYLTKNVSQDNTIEGMVVIINHMHGFKHNLEPKNRRKIAEILLSYTPSILEGTASVDVINNAVYEEIGEYGLSAVTKGMHALNPEAYPIIADRYLRGVAGCENTWSTYESFIENIYTVLQQGGKDLSGWGTYEFDTMLWYEAKMRRF